MWCVRGTVKVVVRRLLNASVSLKMLKIRLPKTEIPSCSFVDAIDDRKQNGLGRKKINGPDFILEEMAFSFEILLLLKSHETFLKFVKIK